MKAYNHKLTGNMIKKMNDLYEDENSWWHKIVEDDEVFIRIRKNELRVMIHGGLLLLVTMKAGKIVCKINEEYLFLKSDRDPYIVLEESGRTAKYVKGLEEFVRHYSKIKRRIKSLIGKERQVSHALSLNIKQMVDREVGLVDKPESKNVKFVDLAAVSDAGMLVFYEVKLFDNNEIRSLKTPRVVKQIQIYERLIKANQDKIIKAYNDQFQVISQLKGSFFKKRLPAPKVSYVHPRVRLIITDYDDAQRKWFLPQIRSQLEESLKTSDIITVGGYRNIKKERLFRGL